MEALAQTGPQVEARSGVHDIRDHVDLIATKIDDSVTTPQQGPDGRTFLLKDLTHQQIRGCPQHGTESEIEPIRRVFRFVKHNVEYRQDPSGYEQFMTAGRTITSGAGDCDDLTILINSMLSSVGYVTGSRVISPDGHSWHIYSIIGINPAFMGTPSEVLPLDAAYGDRVGWEPPDQYRKHEYQCTFWQGSVVHWERVR